MSDIESDNESYLSEEEEEEEFPHKKGIKTGVPHSFGNTIADQNIIGNEDSDEEAMDEEDKPTPNSAKGKKKGGKKTEEEYDQDYEEEYDNESDHDSDSDEEEEEDGIDEEEYPDDSDSDEKEGEDEPEKYMHHFDKEITKDYILETHPECIPVNMEEVGAMLRVVRNKDGVIIDDFHKTIPFVTKYEKARIIGQRAMQLDSGATPYINPGILIDGTSIAEREFEEKKIPVIIKRPLPNGAFEYWRLKDLEILY